MKSGPISKEELLASYMEEVKKDLTKNMGIEFSNNISMVISNEEEGSCLVESSQSVHSAEEMDIESIESFLQQIKNQMGEFSNKEKNKGIKFNFATPTYE